MSALYRSVSPEGAHELSISPVLRDDALNESRWAECSCGDFAGIAAPTMGGIFEARRQWIDHVKAGES